MDKIPVTSPLRSDPKEEEGQLRNEDFQVNSITSEKAEIHYKTKPQIIKKNSDVPYKAGNEV